MARTKQVARQSTGGVPPRMVLACRARRSISRKKRKRRADDSLGTKDDPVEVDSGCEDGSGSEDCSGSEDGSGSGSESGSGDEEAIWDSEEEAAEKARYAEELQAEKDAAKGEKKDEAKGEKKEEAAVPEKDTAKGDVKDGDKTEAVV